VIFAKVERRNTMNHILQFAIDIDDATIVKSIEKNAEEQIINKIGKEVEERIYERRYGSWHGNSYINKSPLDRMIKEEINKIIDENRDYILREASRQLADRLFRSKAGKALIDEMRDENDT
jgi:hypothetical protein